MYQPITYSLLVEKNACSEQLALFKKHFGKIKAIPLTKKVVDKFSREFSIIWAARNLLTQEDYEEYDKVTNTAYAEYKKVRETAYAKYEKVTATAYAEYEKVTRPDWEEFNKACAVAFIKIYKKGLI